jgi:hypothetical protein
MNTGTSTQYSRPQHQIRRVLSVVFVHFTDLASNKIVAMMALQRSMKIVCQLLAILSIASAFVAPGPTNFPNRNLVLSRNHEKQQLLPMSKRPSTELNAIMEIVGVSAEPIHTAFSFATFGPQPFWLLLILLPKSEITKKLMGTMGMQNIAFEITLVNMCVL